MTAIDLVLRAVGAFYILAGFVATRAALSSRFLDHAIAALGGEAPSAAETLKFRWHVASSAIILIGGVALLLLVDAAVWLFLLSSALQALYLVWVAPRYIDPWDEPDATGRSQTRNAFVVYLLATALVVWALSAGRLSSVAATAWPALAAGGLIVLLYAADLVRNRARRTEPQPPFAAVECEDPVQRAQSQRIKLMPEPGSYPLWAIDAGLYGDIAPSDLGLSDELQRELAALSDHYERLMDPDNAMQIRGSDEEKAIYDARQRQLARRLQRELPDRTIFIVDPTTGVVEAGSEDEDEIRNL